MKVQLIVVQGKPEGKTIPLLGPRFKIGRGETCHLRPNSEQVSREHAEFSVAPTGVSVADLGSRNGTLVNGRAITGPSALKNGDLVQVGPLTFAVSIQGAPPEVAKPTAPPKSVKASLDDVSNDEIDSWLVSDSAKAAAPESPSGVYGGDTITIAAFTTEATAAKNAPATPSPTAPTQAPDDSDEGYERLESGDEESDSDDNENEDDDNEEPNPDDMPEEFIDESNPFYVKKNKGGEPAAGTGKPVYKDTSDAAQDILRKMMERRKQK